MPNASIADDPTRRLRLARQQLGLTQADVARRLGISQATYARWESEPLKIPIGRYLEIARTLDVPLPAVGVAPLEDMVEGFLWRCERLDDDALLATLRLFGPWEARWAALKARGRAVQRVRRNPRAGQPGPAGRTPSQARRSGSPPRP